MKVEDRRQRLERLRAELAAEIAAGRRPDALLARLADGDGVALAELVVGPKAPASPLLVNAALTVLPALEAAIAPKALYQRLVGLSRDTATDVLEHAAARHPLARWMVKLSETVEGPAAGRIHLTSLHDHPALAWACQAHAEARHDRGLVAAASVLGLPEPAAALAAEGRADAAAEALVRTIERRPDSPVVAWVAASWGPDLESLLAGTVRFLRDRPTADALMPWLAAVPRAGAALAAVRPALPVVRPDHPAG